MSHIINVNRRRFLKATGVAGGAFILGAAIPGLSIAAGNNADQASAELGVFVSIESNGAVKIFCHRMEMGQAY